MFTDDFTRSNRDLDGDNGWKLETTLVDNSAEIASNQAANKGSNLYSNVFRNGEAYTQQHYAQANIVRNDFFVASVQVRVNTTVQTTKNWYGGGYNHFHGPNNNWRVYKFVTDSYTSLTASATAVVNGDLAYLEVSSTVAPYTLNLYVNSSLHLTTTDSSLNPTNSAPGLVCVNNAGSTPFLDNFQSDDLTAAGQPTMRRFGLCNDTGRILRPVELGHQSVRVFRTGDLARYAREHLKGRRQSWQTT